MIWSNWYSQQFQVNYIEKIPRACLFSQYVSVGQLNDGLEFWKGASLNMTIIFINCSKAQDGFRNNVIFQWFDWLTWKRFEAHFERKINSQAVEYFTKNFRATILEDIRFALKKVKDRNEVDFLTKVQSVIFWCILGYSTVLFSRITNLNHWSKN